MKIRHFKWLSIFSTVLLVMFFEFLRHEYMNAAAMDFGNVLVALFAGILFFCWFSAVFRYIEKLSAKIQEEETHLAVLKERNKNARLLHDNFAQALFFINVKAREIEKAAPSLRQIHELREAVQMADNDLRSSIFFLGENEGRADTRNIREIIEESAKLLTEGQGTAVSLEIDQTADKFFDLAARRKILRIVREIFLNIKKHADARHVSLRLSRLGKIVLLRIADDGSGFPAQKAGRRLSFGLQSIMEDIKTIGGSIDFAESGTQGTVVNIKIDFSGEA
jgi:two-component system nitrate/nitrite sensor histidine kinase NarX